MVSPSEIILEYVCPSLGMLVANLMFLAPMKDLQSAVSIGQGLGDLNPTPWAFMLGNCLGWTSYGVLLSNWFIFWANYPGFLIACWLNLGAVKLMYASHHKEATRRSLVEYLSSSTSAAAAIASMEASIQGDTEKERQPFLCDESNPKRQHESDDDENDDTRTTEEIVKDPTKIVDCGDGIASTNKIASSSASTQVGTNLSASINPKFQQQDWAKIVWEVTSQTTPAKTPHERLVMGIVIVWTVVLSTIGFYKHYASLNNDSEQSSNANNVAQSIVGYVVNFNLVFFYGAPLSAISRVLNTKRFDSLHVPTMIMNTSNAIFWTSYALAPQINDPFIYVPNGLGVLLGTIQFSLWMIFPKTANGESERPSATGRSIQDNCDGMRNDNEKNEKPGDTESTTMVASV
jgi:solute carrier family 50 protein (sugar transporter)